MNLRTEISVQVSQEDSLEEGMATPSNILAQEILWMEETGGLQSMGMQRVGHDWSNLARTHACLWGQALIHPLSSILL